MATTQATRTQPNPHPLLWTKEQYHRMAEMGLLDGKRVELLNGEIIEMSPMSSPHWSSVVLVEQALRDVFGAGYLVVSQLPLNAGDDSEPEPDVTVLKGSARDYKQELPTTALLVVEISRSTLEFDRTQKMQLYAVAKMPEYWILNLNENQLEVHRQPVGDIYSEKIVLKADQTVSPLAAPDARIKIADMLP